MKSEHIVVSSWLRSRCYISYSCCFLPEYLLPHGLQPREVYHQEVFLRLHASGHFQLLESKKIPEIILNPSVNGSNKSNTVSSTSSSRSKFPLVCENSMDGTGIKFSMLHSITFLYLFSDLEVFPDAHDKEKLSSLHGLPNNSADGESSTKRIHR